MNTIQITGTAFLGTDFSPENVELTINNGIIADISPARENSGKLILPAFFNAHTHIGDTVGMDTPIDRPLKELVAPPDGLKHVILRETPKDTLISAMRHSMEFMVKGGTTGFADFREGGKEGVEALTKARIPGITPVILGRDGGELTGEAAGLGLSNAHRLDAEIEAAAAAKKAGKLVAVHAGEGGIKDIEPAFELEPDVIIHATNFRPQDIRRAADEDIAVVLCPRSNWLLGVTDSAKKPPVRELLDAGCRVYLGTDNVMFVSPDMAAECAFLMTAYKTTAEETLSMASGGFSLAGTSSLIEKGKPANLYVMDDAGLLSLSRKPLTTALTRLGRGHVCQVIAHGEDIYSKKYE